MFSRRLRWAFVLLALVALVQAALAAWVLASAAGHVASGREASDLYSGFLRVQVAKQKLRSWTAQALLGADARSAEREAWLAEMQRALADLHLLADNAALRRGDHSGSGRSGNPIDSARKSALATLDLGFAALQRELAQVQPLAAGADATAAWTAIAAVFESTGGVDLRETLASATTRELDAMARERAAADTAFTRLKTLAWAAGLLLAAGALLGLVHFSRALRRPLHALQAAAQALQAGNLAHRIDIERSDDEFGRLAGHVNALAAELQERRARDEDARGLLEQQVRLRTAELASALERLQAFEQRRRQLLADVSHELRTPTTAIRGEAEVTLRGRDKPLEEYKAALARIVEAAHHLGMVIDDLLAVARSDIDSLLLLRERVRLAEPLAEALAQAQALAARGGVRLQAPAPDDTPVGLAIEGDHQRLRQLFLLLLDNAVGYSHPQGRVWVRTRLDAAQGRWELLVDDEGIGIPAAELPQVFDRHFRGRAARAHREGGSGLGLPLARALAEAHGGTLALQARPEGGTRARLTLPLLDPALKPEAPPTPQALPLDGHPAR
jgi:two-component system, OmpR family, sensor kinase